MQARKIGLLAIFQIAGLPKKKLPAPIITTFGFDIFFSSRLSVYLDRAYTHPVISASSFE
jgi:hypothetical protein